ncbi:MAG: serine/threonine protein kinase [Deltaproteobacteria bacterium]|nr:serine/threonine protein kinase [Deltaproteobacteria bacterium]
MADFLAEATRRAFDGFERDTSSAREAQVELCLLEAGAAARSLPLVAQWLGAGDRFTRFIEGRVRGTLRERVLAARALSAAVEGLDPARASSATSVARSLATHPEPLVWIPAARSLGRLAGRVSDARTLLFEWLSSGSLGERRRATTALGAMPGDVWWLEARLDELFHADADPWAVAALGPSLPFIACDRRELFDEIVRRLDESLESFSRGRRKSTQLGVEVFWSLTDGLLTIGRRGFSDRATDRLLDRIRGVALEVETRSITEAQLWLKIVRATDHLDGLDPDPTDPELLFERTLSAAVRAGADKVASRALGLAGSLGGLFEAALPAALEGSVPERARALYTLESVARAVALDLSNPIARAAGVATFDSSALREVIAARMSSALHRGEPEFALHRTTLRVLSSFLDSAAEQQRARAAEFVFSSIDSTEWLRHPDKRTASRFQKPLADVSYRLFDATRVRGGAIPESVELSRFAAWWAIAAHGLGPLEHLGRAEAAAREHDVSRAVETIRETLRPSDRVETLSGVVLNALRSLGTEDTALYVGLRALDAALEEARRARMTPSAEAKKDALLALGAAAREVAPLLTDPCRALARPAGWGRDEQVEELVVRSIQLLSGGERDELGPSTGERWRLALGPVLGPIVKASVERLLATSSVAPEPERKSLGGYKLIQRLGGGAQGEVWLVERPPLGRKFVMKVLRPDVTKDVRDRLDRALLAESEILKQIYHPNVASFIDAGGEGESRFLVLERLVGVDLLGFARAKLLTLQELEPIVDDVTNGLMALESFGLVHSDVNPQNIFVRLPLGPSDRFEPDRHRTQARVLGAVVIDFGIARSRALSGAGLLSGTPGYLAPEQTEGRVHARTDVYGLAATVFRALSGSSFFETVDSLTSRLLMHQGRAPMSDPRNLEKWPKDLPKPLLSLIEESTAIDPEERPSLRAFSIRFRECVGRAK